MLEEMDEEFGVGDLVMESVKEEQNKVWYYYVYIYQWYCGNIIVMVACVRINCSLLVNEGP